MVPKYIVETPEEFEQIMVDDGLEISKTIVKKALANLDSSKRFIHIFDVEVTEDDSILEVTLDRRDMLETLEKNLEIHEYFEEYEGCGEIKKAIDKLKQKENE